MKPCKSNLKVRKKTGTETRQKNMGLPHCSPLFSQSFISIKCLMNSSNLSHLDLCHCHFVCDISHLLNTSPFYGYPTTGITLSQVLLSIPKPEGSKTQESQHNNTGPTQQPHKHSQASTHCSPLLYSSPILLLASPTTGKKQLFSAAVLLYFHTGRHTSFPHTNTSTPNCLLAQLFQPMLLYSCVGEKA